MLAVVADFMSGKPIAASLEGRSLADLFKEWRAVNATFAVNKSDSMVFVFGKVEAELEARMVEAGVHSPADAAAVIAWHRIVCPGMMYDWGHDAEHGTSGKLLAAVEAYGEAA